MRDDGPTWTPVDCLEPYDGSSAKFSCNQNSIMALLNGPDTKYQQMLIDATKPSAVAMIDERARDKAAFLQIHVRK